MAEQPYYRGPFVLMRDSRTGVLTFVPAKQVQLTDDPRSVQWVPLTNEEIEEQKR